MWGPASPVCLHVPGMCALLHSFRSIAVNASANCQPQPSLQSQWFACSRAWTTATIYFLAALPFFCLHHLGPLRRRIILPTFSYTAMVMEASGPR